MIGLCYNINSYNNRHIYLIKLHDFFFKDDDVDRDDALKKECGEMVEMID